ncbi:MAG: hypothetical protein CVT75_01625 [Alphaproteobacteria bacterium HGW-Alphaproteobacteria-14]|nr:MAG: hypothetical protein CVT75_01625 [Alphaproteobacteria bacterium HGW-Alphaproteobacteria-14]
MNTDAAPDIEAFMTDREREMLLLCSSKTTKGYERLAEAMGLSYNETQQVGRDLQATGVAGIRLLNPGFNGSGIFLNERGEEVKRLLEAKGWTKVD